MRREVRITGYGGQGVILSAHILGKAATIYDGRHATMTQSFGPEARGSACSAQLVISDEPIDYPYLREMDVLVAMSQEGFDLFIDKLKEGGVLIVEQDLVRLDRHADRPRTFAVPATRIAENLGRRIVQNMAMLGYVGAMTDLVQVDSLRQAIASSVPTGTEDLHLTAFEGGYAFHREKERVGGGGRNRGDPGGS